MMQTVVSSLVGGAGLPLFQVIILIGLLVVAIFRPGRVGSWAALSLSVRCLILGIALPSLVAFMPLNAAGSWPGSQFLWKVLASAGGLLTAASLYFLWEGLSKPSGPFAVEGKRSEQG